MSNREGKKRRKQISSSRPPLPLRSWSARRPHVRPHFRLVQGEARACRRGTTLLLTLVLVVSLGGASSLRLLCGGSGGASVVSALGAGWRGECAQQRVERGVGGGHRCHSRVARVAAAAMGRPTSALLRGHIWAHLIDGARYRSRRETRQIWASYRTRHRFGFPFA